MPRTSLSDMAQSFVQMRANTALRTRLATLSQELSSGKTADLTARLKGDTAAIRDIDRQLGLATTHIRAATEAAQWTDALQARLGRIEDERQALSDGLLALGPEPSVQQRAAATDAGRTAFEATVSALNARFAGQALFAGRATDATALAAAPDMLAALRTAAAGATTAADLATAVDTWFDTAGGGFETAGYLGDAAGHLARRIDEDLSIAPGLRADDPALRAVLKASALAVLAEDATVALPDAERVAALRDAAARTLDTEAGLTGLRARLGQSEGLIERRQASVAARLTALSITRNETDAADPFETASALQDVQVLLETHYAVTARLSRLNLTEYLR